MSDRYTIGIWTGRPDGTPNPGYFGANVAALCRGARIFRVHDVRATRDALDVAWAVLAAPQGAAEDAP